MRVVKRNLSKIEFDRVTQPIFLTRYMDEIVQWNTDQLAITKKQTQPLHITIEPDSWSAWQRQNIPVESWVVR